MEKYFSLFNRSWIEKIEKQRLSETNDKNSVLTMKYIMEKYCEERNKEFDRRREIEQKIENEKKKMEKFSYIYIGDKKYKIDKKNDEAIEGWGYMQEMIDMIGFVYTEENCKRKEDYMCCFQVGGNRCCKTAKFVLPYGHEFLGKKNVFCSYDFLDEKNICVVFSNNWSKSSYIILCIEHFIYAVKHCKSDLYEMIEDIDIGDHSCNQLKNEEP